MIYAWLDKTHLFPVLLIEWTLNQILNCEYTNSYKLLSISLTIKCIFQLILLDLISIQLIMVLFIRQSYSYDRKVKRIHIKCSSLLHICWRIQFVQYHYIPNIPLLFCYRISRMRLRMRWNGTTISTGKVLNVAYESVFETHCNTTLHLVFLQEIYSSSMFNL